MKTLFDEKTFAVPARADSPPQVEAARKVAPHAGRQARRILEALKMCGPQTREEIARLTGIPTTSVCARLREMECPDSRRHAFLAGEPLVTKIGRKEARSGVRVYLYDLTTAGRKA